MKKCILCLMLAVVLLMSSCAVECNAFVSDKSYMTGWYVDNGVVYIVCRLIIFADEDMSVSINALSEEDVYGLLQSPELTGYNEDMSSTVFDLAKGKNQMIVVFVGVHGLTDVKTDYYVPDVITLDRIK